jgi:hypothetical protein
MGRAVEAHQALADHTPQHHRSVRLAATASVTRQTTRWVAPLGSLSKRLETGRLASGKERAVRPSDDPRMQTPGPHTCLTVSQPKHLGWVAFASSARGWKRMRVGWGREPRPREAEASNRRNSDADARRHRHHPGHHVCHHDHIGDGAATATVTWTLRPLLVVDPSTLARQCDCSHGVFSLCCQLRKFSEHPRADSTKDGRKLNSADISGPLKE